jgi:hypothetical protein
MDDHAGGPQQPFEKSRRWAETRPDSTNLVRLFGQMMMLPLAVFAYGMELFVRTVQGVQRVADDGLDALAGSATRTPVETPDSQSERESSPAISSTGVDVDGDAEINPKETMKMNDTDLSDDKLKLVRYKILFVKRDYEVAFDEREDLVYDNMTGEAFAAWKVAEFIQRLGREPVPAKWLKKNYPRDFTPEERDGARNVYVNTLDEDDKKYLRVYFEVLDRYEREDANYDQDQIDVLKQIRDRL